MSTKGSSMSKEQLIRISNDEYTYRGWSVYRNKERYAKSSVWATRAPDEFMGVLKEFAGPSLEAIKEDIDWLLDWSNE